MYTFWLQQPIINYFNKLLAQFIKGFMLTVEVFITDILLWTLSRIKQPHFPRGVWMILLTLLQSIQTYSPFVQTA